MYCVVWTLYIDDLMNSNQEMDIFHGAKHPYEIFFFQNGEKEKKKNVADNV